MHTSLKIVGVSLVLACGAAGGYGYGLYLITTEMAQASALVSEIDTLARKEQSLRATQEAINDIREERAELDSYFLQEKELVRFLETIEEVGEQANTTIEVKSVSEERMALPDFEEAAAPVLRLTLTIDGTWRNVFHAVALLETFPLPLDVHAVTLERQSSAPGEGVVPWRGVVLMSIARR